LSTEARGVLERVGFPGRPLCRRIPFSKSAISAHAFRALPDTSPFEAMDLKVIKESYTMSQPSQIHLFDNSDAEMQAAYKKAQASFGYFWREIAWERRRIVKGLDAAYVKAPFSDLGVDSRPKAKEIEHMWIDQVDFDGETISGHLVNEPDKLRSVKQGDAVQMQLSAISDWMYVLNNRAYGGFTINLMRSRMKRDERAAHDKAWGLDFGDPQKPEVVPPSATKGWFNFKKSTKVGEHPMSENMAPKLAEEIAKNPAMLSWKDEHGWGLLHELALAGSYACVKVLLEKGADPRTVTQNGSTPLSLAQSLNWEDVAELLRAHGATH